MFWPIVAFVAFVLVVGLFTRGIRIGSGRPAPPPLVDWTQEDTPTEWGRIIDPDGDCRPTWQGGGVTLTVPGGVHELQGNGKQNAPRVMQTMHGDFAMEIELAGEWNPRSGGSFPFAPFQGAGIMIRIAENEFLRFERAMIKTPIGSGVSYVHFEGHAARGPQPIGSVQLSDADFPTLRVERHGEQVYAMIRQGADSWRQVGAVGAVPDEIEVGVAAVSNTNEPFDVQFTRVRFFRPR